MVQYHCPTITISACKKEHTAQKMKFSMKDFFSKYDQICSFLWIWSHLMKKSFLNGKLHFLCSDTFFKNTSLWLLLTGKQLCRSLFLILSIAKCFRAHILKSICERLLLRKYVHETEKNQDLFARNFNFTLKNRFLKMTVFIL